MEGGSEPSRYVEVRICYRFTTLINIEDMQLPLGWDISVGEVYLQKDRAFTVGWYPPRPTPSPPPAPTPPPPTVGADRVTEPHANRVAHRHAGANWPSHSNAGSDAEPDAVPAARGELHGHAHQRKEAAHRQLPEYLDVRVRDPDLLVGLR